MTLTRGVWDSTPLSGVSFVEHSQALTLHLHGFVKKAIHYQAIATPVWLSLGSHILVYIQDSPAFTELKYISAVDRLAALSIAPFATFEAFGGALKEVGEFAGLRVFLEPTKTKSSVWTTSGDDRVCFAEYEITGT